MAKVLVTRNIPQQAIERVRGACEVKQWESDAADPARCAAGVGAGRGWDLLPVDGAHRRCAAGRGGAAAQGGEHDVGGLRPRGSAGAAGTWGGAGQHAGCADGDDGGPGAGAAAGGGPAAAGGMERRQGWHVGTLAARVDDRPRRPRQHGGDRRPGSHRRRGGAAAVGVWLPHRLQRPAAAAGAGGAAGRDLPVRSSSCWQRATLSPFTVPSTMPHDICSAQPPLRR